MKTAIALLLLTLTAPAHAASPGRSRIAVTEIKNVQGVAPGTATILSDIVVSEVARHGFGVVSQNDIDAMLGFEKKKQMLGCSEETSCLAEIGGALGVDFLLTGQVGKIGSRYRLSLMVVDARRATVLARAARFSDANEDDLAKAAEETVSSLMKEIAAYRAQAASPKPSEPAPATRPEKGASPPKGVAPGLAAAPDSKSAPKPDLTPRPGAAEPSPLGVEPAPSRRLGRQVGWWAVGGGGALVLVGAVTGLAARSKLSELKSSWADPNYPSVYDSKSGSVKTLSIVADGCFVAGLATAGWGSWLLLRKEPAAAPVVVAPVPLDGGGALVASGRF